MTIQFTESALLISQPVAKALLAFASTDSTRMHLHCVALTDIGLCATDGHTLIAFDTPGRPGAWGHESMQRCWGVDYVKRAIGLAKLGEKGSLCELRLSDRVEVVFPPVAQVIPEDGFAIPTEGNKRGKAPAPFGINPESLARLVVVEQACEQSRKQMGVKLVGLNGPLDPWKFRVEGNDAGATVVIMPMRV